MSVYILHISLTVALFHASLKGKLSKILRKTMRYLSSRLTYLSLFLINFTMNLIIKAFQNNAVFLFLQFCLTLSITPPNSNYFYSTTELAQSYNSAFVSSPSAVSDGLCKGVTCWGEEESGREVRQLQESWKEML